MVHKVKIFIFFIILIVLGFFALNFSGKIETNLLRTLIPQEAVNSTDIIEIADKISSDVKVVFESDDENNLEELRKNFTNKIDTGYFKLDNTDYTELIKLYSNYPANFLSYNTRTILKDKNYDKVYSSALERIYNPAGINLSSLEKDPYLFADDFVNSLPKISTTEFMNNKYYDYLLLLTLNGDSLPPDSENKKIAELVKIQKELSKNGNQIYLAGSPIHTYYTSRNSILSINVISILSILMIVFLTYFYFRSFIPILITGLCILTGMLGGYDVTRLWFKDFQIITMVFSCSLIGIGVDYSYHYFFNQNNKDFFKNLTISFFTTIIPFFLLYLTEIELLKQISVFTVSGLLTIYLEVILLFPAIGSFKPLKTININKRIVKIILFIVVTFSLTGFFRFNINDSVTSLYSPNKQLQNAENLYKNIFENGNDVKQIIKIHGKDTQEILEAEEAVTDSLRKENINFISLSTFIPSVQRQNENYKLVKQLYENNLCHFSDILTNIQTANLKAQKFIPVIPDFNDLYFLKYFILNENTSLIIVNSSKQLDLENTINLQTDISKYLKDYRIRVCKIIPISIFIIMSVLIMCFGLKKGLNILLPSVCGIIVSCGLTLLITGEINVFSIIALFMVLGFTIDYSVFRTEQKQETEDAILTSAITTTFAFLLLSLCGFKMLSSISLILFLGILTSYLTGKAIKDSSKT